MKISEYPSVTTVSYSDRIIVETGNGTHTATVNQLKDAVGFDPSKLEDLQFDETSVNDDVIVETSTGTKKTEIANVGTLLKDNYYDDYYAPRQVYEDKRIVMELSEGIRDNVAEWNFLLSKNMKINVPYNKIKDSIIIGGSGNKINVPTGNVYSAGIINSTTSYIDDHFASEDSNNYIETSAIINSMDSKIEFYTKIHTCSNLSIISSTGSKIIPGGNNPVDDDPTSDGCYINDVSIISSAYSKISTPRYYPAASLGYSGILFGSYNEIKSTGLNMTIIGGTKNIIRGLDGFGAKSNKNDNCVILGGHDLSIDMMTVDEYHNMSNVVVMGTVNKPVEHYDALVIGNGFKNTNGAVQHSNCFRVTTEGEVYGLTSFKSSGADYAEFIKEWADGNPNNEDRVGYFVTIKNGKLNKAFPGDYIVGITSGNPSIVGNADEDYYWMYERDEFNRIVYEEVHEALPEVNKETGEVMYVESEYTKRVMKRSKDYDQNLQIKYVQRKDRKEWDYVGMMGVIPVRDDGTCLPDHFCKCTTGGIATIAEERNFDTYYVIERISDNVVSVIVK